MCCCISFILPVSLVHPLPLFLPRRPFYNFRANHETRAVRGGAERLPESPVAPHPVRGDDMSAVVTTCRHRLPGRAVEPPSSQPVTCRAGRDLTPHGRRASGRVERWHGKCLLKDLTAPFYGANRPDATVSQGLRDAFWLQGMQAGFKAVLDCIKAFSETDFTDDLKKMDVPTLILHGDDDQIVPIGASAMLSSKLVKGSTLKIYPGFDHGMCSTHKGPDQRRSARVPQGVSEATLRGGCRLALQEQ